MKLSADLRVSMDMALAEARQRRHEFSTVEHLLYAFLHDEATRQAIKNAGADLDVLRSGLESHLDDDVPRIPETAVLRVHPSIGFSRVVQRAALHVQGAGKEEVEPVNVLVAMYSEPDGHASYLLEESGARRLDVVRFLSHGIAKRGGPGPGKGDALSGGGEFGGEGGETETNPLEAYASNLNERAKKGGIDPLIGREREVARVIHIVARRRKNNPMLVGDAGVGKTAIVEGLAKKIVDGDVPPMLKDVVVYALDMGAVVAGTRYRGDFEERIKGVIDALKATDGKSILFIDEVHTVLGAGATTGGSLDASNMIKPALANGELRVIGATTFDEYRKYVERDSAFARRFQKVDIPEPTRDDAVAILIGLQKTYEDYHKVTYNPDAIEAAVDLSARYITDRKLPDKAIDVIDEAGAAHSLAGLKVVDLAAVQTTIATMARVPAEKITKNDRDGLKDLEAKIRRKVFGQDHAIARVAKAVKLARAGLRNVDKPIGSFLFAGPTGVGKTELAKQLARTLNLKFTRFDMSEYMERINVSRLIGSAPGYVGFDDGGQLTDAVTKHPHSVILLDEIEKAHPDVFNLLLQVMDHGTLTDQRGKKADFRHVILIMTSNIGARDLSSRKLGFSESVQFGTSDEAYKRMFSPEFRNRLDAKVDFNALPREVMLSIVDKFTRELDAQLADRRIAIELDEDARTYLATKGYDPSQGARPMARLMRVEISEPLSEEILYGKLEHGGLVKISVVDEALSFDITSNAAPEPGDSEDGLEAATRDTVEAKV